MRILSHSGAVPDVILDGFIACQQISYRLEGTPGIQAFYFAGALYSFSKLLR